MAKVEGSKATAIRDYMTANPNSTPAQVAEGLADRGVTARQVYNVRSGVAAKKAKAKKASRKKSVGKKTPATEVGDANAADGKNVKAGRGKSRPYPQRTLEEALAVPKAIKEKTNGRPMDTEQVAKATLNLTKLNNRFFYLAAASRDYGLTIGSRDTDEIALALNQASFPRFVG
jgi:hypothetical protein